MRELRDLLQSTALGRETLAAEQRQREQQIRHLSLEEQAENERHQAARAKLVPALTRAQEQHAPVAARYELSLQAVFTADRELNQEGRRHDHRIAQLRRARRDLADPRIAHLRQVLDELANDNGAAWILNAPIETVRMRGAALRAARARCDELLETYEPGTLEQELAAIRAAVAESGVEL